MVVCTFSILCYWIQGGRCSVPTLTHSHYGRELSLQPEKENIQAHSQNSRVSEWPEGLLSTCPPSQLLFPQHMSAGLHAQRSSSPPLGPPAGRCVSQVRSPGACPAATWCEHPDAGERPWVCGSRCSPLLLTREARAPPSDLHDPAPARSPSQAALVRVIRGKGLRLRGLLSDPLPPSLRPCRLVRPRRRELPGGRQHGSCRR